MGVLNVLNKKKKVGLSFLFGIFIFLILITCLKLRVSGYEINYLIEYENQSNTQVFYGYDSENFVETNSAIFNVEGQESTEISLTSSENFRYLRVDLGSTDNYISISNLGISCYKTEMLIPDFIVFTQGVKNLNYQNDIYKITVEGNDPYIVFDLSVPLQHLQQFVQKLNIYLLAVTAAVAIAVTMIFYHKYSSIVFNIKWLLNVLKEWRRIKGLALNDFKMKYASSYLGTFWAFVQPIVTVTIYSVIFGMGFKSLPVEGVSFPLWLTVGIIPWFFFSEALMSATNSLLEYSYLVKKVVFQVNVLPIVKIVSSGFVHAFFIVVAIFMLIVTKGKITPYILQVFYYSFCTVVLVLGISYITSATVVFFKDLGQVVNILLQFGMWATPIMYPASFLGPQVEVFFHLNPMFYIVDGYRDAFFQQIWFWEKPLLSLYFWTITCVILYIGISVFGRLEKHFADVL